MSKVEIERGRIPDDREYMRQNRQNRRRDEREDTNKWTYYREREGGRKGDRVRFVAADELTPDECRQRHEHITTKTRKKKRRRRRRHIL